MEKQKITLFILYNKTAQKTKTHKTVLGVRFLKAIHRLRMGIGAFFFTMNGNENGSYHCLDCVDIVIDIIFKKLIN